MSETQRRSQGEKILAYMMEHGSIDPMRAINDLRVLRLGARIFDLKAAGIPIVTEIKYKTAEDGTHTHWAEYRLGETAS